MEVNKTFCDREERTENDLEDFYKICEQSETDAINETTQNNDFQMMRFVKILCLHCVKCH